MATQVEDRTLRFERLYDRYHAQVLAYAVRRVARSEAEDACAETFLVAWRRIDEVPDADGSLPYLYAIAARTLANRRRSSWRRRRLLSKARRAEVRDPNDPVAMVLRRDQDRSIEAAVLDLPAKYRDVVMLYAWDDLTRAQIASMMGISKSAVDQRIHRAYRRLARSLRHELSDAPDDAASSMRWNLDEGGAR